MFHVIHRTPLGIISEADVEATTVWEAIEMLNIPVNTLPTVCLRDDAPVKREFWHTIDHDPSTELTFVTIPQGDALKNILSLVATIALVIVAPYATGFIAPLLGVTSTLGLQLLQAGIVLAGSFLISTFLSPSVNTPSSKNAAAASPTYSLTGQGNTARLFESIPKLYGTHLLYPDYASGPYSEFIDNQQYLNQLLCLGLGEYEIHEMRIEDTTFWNELDGFVGTFVGVQYEIIKPGDAVTLFHSQVISSAEVGGQDLILWGFKTDYVFNGTRITSKHAEDNQEKRFTQAVVGQEIEVVGGPYAGVYTITGVATDGTWLEVFGAAFANTTVDNIVVQRSPADAWVGPYVSNSADTVTNKIQIDYTIGNGLFYTSDDGSLTNNSVTVVAQAQTINSAGIAVGGWFDLGTHTYTAATQTPQRKTETYFLPDARYQVRVRRVDNENPSTRYRSSIAWNGLKAFIPNDNVYPDVTLLAIRMLATGQLTQSSSNKINTIQTAKLPVWNPVTRVWSDPIGTTSIAWAAADVLRNSTYGANFDSDYIDLDKLAELDNTWSSRVDTFNGVFDTTYSIWDALNMILKVGRTIPVMIGGKMTFVRDEHRVMPRCIFNPATMQRGSFQTQHILYDDESPDDIIVQFLDHRTWKQNEVDCKQVDSISAKPERMQIFGITHRDQAWREGMFMGAVNARRRVIATFTTEMEGRMMMRGDLIGVAHDLYEWGDFGEVQGFDLGTKTLWLSESPTFDSSNAYIRLRKRNGKAWGPVKIGPYVDNPFDDYKVTIDATDLAFVEASQGSIVDVFNLESDSVLTTYIIGEQTTDFKDFIIVSGDPTDELVNLTCIIEDPEVHLVDLGSPPPETYPYQPGGAGNRPIISFLAVTENTITDPNFPSLTFAWGADSNATSYRLEISYDNVNWQLMYAGPGTSFVGSVYAGVLYSRVLGINTQSGAWKYFTGTFGIGTATPLPPEVVNVGYSIAAGSLAISWSPSIRAQSYIVKVYAEGVTGSGIFNLTVLTTNQIGTSINYTSDAVLAAGGPWPTIKVGVTAVNSLGNSTEKVVTVSGITLNPVEGLAIQSGYNRSSFTIQWQPNPSANSYLVELVVDGVVKITYTSLSNTQSVYLNDMQAVGGPWRKFTVSVKANANALQSAATSIIVLAPTILPITGAGGSFSGTAVNLSWNQTSDNAVPKTRVWHNTVNNFSTATVINTQSKAAGASASYSHAVAAGSRNHYYFITAWDDVTPMESIPVTLTVTA